MRNYPLIVRKRRVWAGWGVSLVTHALTILVLACWIVPQLDRTASSAIDSRWDELTVVEPVIADFPVEEQTDHPDAGGSGLELDFLLASAWMDRASSLPVVDPVTPDVSVAAATPVREQPTQSRRNVVASADQLAAEGTGAGTGAGVGNGVADGFFGMPFELGQRIVFVVDNSRSMNHPHDSPAKTRYRRLKEELVRCILEMKSHQSFYVVFFSNVTTPMPARGLQPATDAVRRPLLYWIARLPAGGAPTDPLEALELGLELRPDVLCFLTDGEFPPGVRRKMESITQNRTAIHTFAFGSAEAEVTLRSLAERNSGEYRFVP